jgi:hypothetical protein
MQGQASEVFAIALRRWTPPLWQYTYPDALIIKGEPIFETTEAFP